MNMRSTWQTATLAAALLTWAAPVAVRAQDAPEAAPTSVEQAAPERAAGPPVVRVANHNWLDMRVYVSRGGGPLESLGFVTSQGVGEFELPRGSLAAMGGLRIVADPVGGRGLYVSPDLYMAPDADVVVTLENALNLSHTILRTRDAVR